MAADHHPKNKKIGGKFHFTKTKIVFLILLIILAGVGSLPLIAKTSTYPLTVVDGTSMYPTLQEGDLVYYHAINNNAVPNGTIIIFSQNQNGNPLSALMPPTVIHRVIDQKINPDGTITYQTKGDNNDFIDGTPVEPNQILGASTIVIPKIGLLFLFIKSPQGLVASVGLIVIIFITSFESKSDKERKKQILLSNLAQKTINKEFPQNLFEKFEMVIKYGDDIATTSINDPEARAIAEWLKKGAIDHNWRIETVECENCKQTAIRLVNRKGRPLKICPCLTEKKETTNPSQEQTKQTKKHKIHFKLLLNKQKP